MGPVAAGVNGMKLEDKDEVIGMEILPSEGEIFLLTSDGKAKRLEHKEFPPQGRYGKGVRIWSLPAKVRLAGIGGGQAASRRHHSPQQGRGQVRAAGRSRDPQAEFLKGRCGCRTQAGRGSGWPYPGLDRRPLRSQGRGREEESRSKKAAKAKKSAKKAPQERPAKKAPKKTAKKEK